MPEVTPMMRQYYDIKEQNPESILFFRLGDFYEMFGDDARTASRELDLTLTTRDRANENPDERIPMCGVPYHSSEAYIARLIAKGYRVAICEQLEDPATAKGLVERNIIRVVTPGTVTEPSMLDESRANYLCAAWVGETDCAAAFAELTTGELTVAVGDLTHIRNELATNAPSEIIVGGARAGELLASLKEQSTALTRRDDARFDAEATAARVKSQLGGAELEPSESLALGALLSYVADTQMRPPRFTALRRTGGEEYMELDAQTARSLELVAAMRTGERKGSLLATLDRTKTPMGRRLLRTWVSRPLRSVAAIRRRLNAVAELVADTVARGELLRELRDVGDVERLTARAVYGTANARDLKSLAASLAGFDALITRARPMRSALLQQVAGMDALTDVLETIETTLGDGDGGILPFSVREGGMIRAGRDAELDRLRGLLQNSSAALTEIERRERETTGLKLKVGYNRVFGYYIEIPRAKSEDVPPTYIRKQTLVNCERFITEELKTLESELLTAKERAAELEFALFAELRDAVSAAAERLGRSASRVAELDALVSLAETAARENYCNPEVDMGGVIDIRDGRHPVVESASRDAPFVPNDTYLDGKSKLGAIITGPNMAGKSTYMRQTALIVLMAQIGSFVPASAARIGVVDRVFTRIGASDDLAAGKSTFMVEMTEVAEILRAATSQSLIILDEVGRGTSTYDGMAIARAVLEHCVTKLRAKTLFATHYHELQVMESEVAGIHNYSITAKKRGGDVIFLRKIVPGGADESYGIEVANLGGVPTSVIKRAREVMEALSLTQSAPAQTRKPAAQMPFASEQMSFADERESAVAERLRRISPDTLTPLEALNLLYELKKKVTE
ncbi:MAG: DNA mismatch repair protein MutS [Oscillospiraceae bacterium]|jgi:DNA mismatch repair protein MutS|nr:DNA mismatch repair protein MutS [Oscillospiraceae bacterium]